MPNIMEIGKNPNYLGAYDLYDLGVPELTVTITDFKEEKVPANGKEEKCAVMYFKENYKPMIINPTNKKRLAKLYKTVKTEKLTGKRITITIEKVKAFGGIHDALRIKQTVPTDTEEKLEKCERCGADITPMAGMTSTQLAEYTAKKYGARLCGSCASSAAKVQKPAEDQNEA